MVDSQRLDFGGITSEALWLLWSENTEEEMVLVGKPRSVTNR